MLKLVWGKTQGSKIADENVEKFARRKIKEYLTNNVSGTMTVHIANDILLTAFRCLIKEGEINHKEVIVIFNNESIDVDRYGSLREWPVGLGDIECGFLIRLLSK